MLVLYPVARNPFLPPLPKQGIRWKTGPAKGKVGIPALPLEPLATPQQSLAAKAAYQKDPRGRKPKNLQPIAPQPQKPENAFAPHAFPNAGKLCFDPGDFFGHSNSGWGSNLDMLPLSHGPVGCGAFPQTTRINLPGFLQGFETFTAIHACTNLKADDLEDGGDAKLSAALDEIETLFPLARGIYILNQDSIDLLDTNVKGIAKVKTKEFGKPVVPPTYPWATRSAAAHAAALKAAKNTHEQPKATPYDVAIPFYRQATGLVWIVSKLLNDIGLNPVHVFTCSSTSDMARIRQCKFVIGFLEGLDPQNDAFLDFHAQRYRQWFSMPPIWTCFLSPSATDASLRAIAAYFDRHVQCHAERIIAVNRAKVEAVIGMYRPRLQGKLVLAPTSIPETQREIFHLLGMRVGNQHGWPSRTGIWRKPRLVCKWEGPKEKAFESYMVEAKPDLVLNYHYDEYNWRKYGLPGLTFSPLFDRGNNYPWAYDGFAYFAAAIDRAVNAPWRKLQKPPWHVASG